MYLAGYSGGGPATTVNDAGNISQTIAIPGGSTGAGTTLDFWIYFPNQLTEWEELVVKAVDVAQLPGPFSPDPVPWVTLTTVNNHTLAKNAWQHVGPLSLAQFAGTSMYLKLQARTDLQYNEVSQQNPIVTENGFYLDDVAIWTPGLHLSVC